MNDKIEKKSWKKYKATILPLWKKPFGILMAYGRRVFFEFEINDTTIAMGGIGCTTSMEIR